MRPMTRAGLDKQPRDVAAMFDGVARRYDLTNTVLSVGQDRRWRRRTRQTPANCSRASGCSTSPPAPVSRPLELAAVGRARPSPATSRSACCAPERTARTEGRCRSSPATRCTCRSPTTSFDAVTISFGLRNVADVTCALREMARVTRPGGRLVVCEFSRPVWRPFRVLYLNYLMRALPAIARRVSSNPDAYVYLAESIRAWPAQDDLARTIATAGWARCATAT